MPSGLPAPVTTAVRSVMFAENIIGRMGIGGRCSWAESSPDMRDYHDREWGVPSYDDRYLFEMLVLEGAQAGLSWATILNRRDGYRGAFANFDSGEVAKFTDSKLEK